MNESRPLMMFAIGQTQGGTTIVQLGITEEDCLLGLKEVFVNARPLPDKMQWLFQEDKKYRLPVAGIETLVAYIMLLGWRSHFEQLPTCIGQYECRMYSETEAYVVTRTKKPPNGDARDYQIFCLDDRFLYHIMRLCLQRARVRRHALRAEGKKKPYSFRTTFGQAFLLGRDLAHVEVGSQILP